jgi:CRP-like cAMP-binding protein
MAEALSTPRSNRLLSALSQSDRDLLQPDLAPVALKCRQVFEEPNAPIRHVYFIEEGIVSVVAITKHIRIQVGIIGHEGMSGVAIVMGNHRSPNLTFVQIAGCGQRISAPKLRDAIKTSGSLHQHLLNFAQGLMTQTAHTAIANGHATIEQRLARSIVMTHDRVNGNDLPLTHESLSLMLGVRRAGVTTGLHVLHEHGLIRVQRGKIIVLDRQGLERIAGAYYGVPESEMQRLMH